MFCFVSFQGSKPFSLISTLYSAVSLSTPSFQNIGLSKLRPLRFLYNKGSVISGFSALRPVSAAYEAGWYHHKIFNLNSEQELWKAEIRSGCIFKKNLTAVAAPEHHYLTPPKPH